MFLVNSRRPLFFDILSIYSFFRSYRVNLPSSFKIVTSYAVIYSISLLVLELVRYKVKLFPDHRNLIKFKNLKKLLNCVGIFLTTPSKIPKNILILGIDSHFVRLSNKANLRLTAIMILTLCLLLILVFIFLIFPRNFTTSLQQKTKYSTTVS